MNNPLATLLVTRYQELQKSLRAIGGSEFSPQTLSNYHYGRRLPAEEALDVLARCYDLAPEVVRDAYQRAVPNAIAGPLGEDPMLGLLGKVVAGDHLIVVTQRSILPGRPDLVSAVAEFLQKGMHLTYVAYLPADDQRGAVPPIWRQNHIDVALQLARHIRRVGRANAGARGKVSYLLIGNPDRVDFAFLRAIGSTVYLCGPGRSPSEPAIGWSEHQHPDGRHYWGPYDDSSLGALHEWFVEWCGLELPDSTYRETSARHSADRGIRFMSLEQFVDEVAAPRQSSGL